MAFPESFKMTDEDGALKQVDVLIKRFSQKFEKQLKNFFGEFSASADLTKFGGDLAVGSIEDLFLNVTIE